RPQRVPRPLRGSPSPHRRPSRRPLLPRRRRRTSESGPMSEPTTLRERVDKLFRSALDRTAEWTELAGLQHDLRQAYDRLQQPMRVAIVGLIKAGKSTMMNALLGEAVVATGTVEATFNVNWLKFGERPVLTVYFKDGRPPEPKSFEELDALTLRA